MMSSVNAAGIESALQLKSSTIRAERDCCISAYPHQLLGRPAGVKSDALSTGQPLRSPTMVELAAETAGNTSTAHHDIFFQNWKGPTRVADSSTSSAAVDCSSNSNVLPGVLTITSQQHFIDNVGRTRSAEFEVDLRSTSAATTHYDTASSLSPIDVNASTSSFDHQRHVSTWKTTMHSEVVSSSSATVAPTQPTCRTLESSHQSSTMSWQPSCQMAMQNDSSTSIIIVQPESKVQSDDFGWNNLQMEGAYDFEDELRTKTEPSAFLPTPSDSGFQYKNSHVNQWMQSFTGGHVAGGHVTSDVMKSDCLNEADCVDNNMNSKSLLTGNETMSTCLGNGSDVTTWRQSDACQYASSTAQTQQETSTPERDLDTICRQTAALDHLTVLRLRTECRSRRLPVSGRKRNLVRRLLPFADTILKHVEVSGPSSSTVMPDGCSRVTGLETPRPSYPMSLIRCSSAPIQTQSDHVDLGSPTEAFNGSESHPSSCDVMRRESDPTYCSGGLFNSPETPNACPDDVLMPGSLRRSSDGTLTDCWVRQQRVIDELRRQLLKYRKALDRVKHRRSTGVAECADVEPLMSAVELQFPVDGGDSMDDESAGFDNTDGCYCYQPLMKDFSPICVEENEMWSNGGVEVDSPVDERVYISRPSCDKQPPDYYEAVKSLEHRTGFDCSAQGARRTDCRQLRSSRRHDALTLMQSHAEFHSFSREGSRKIESKVTSAMTLSDVTRALCRTSTGHDDDTATCHFTIDDVIDVLTSSGELPSGGDYRIQPV